MLRTDQVQLLRRLYVTIDLSTERSQLKAKQTDRRIKRRLLY